jgi:hypothetical protein
MRRSAIFFLNSSWFSYVLPQTFRAWANSQLRRRNVKIETTLDKSFHDGLMLITLVEVLSGEKCASKYHKDPEKEIQKIENISIAIDFLKKFIPNINVSSKGVVRFATQLVGYSVPLLHFFQTLSMAT